MKPEVYRDSNNSPIPLPRLVRTEPDWAVSMIREYRARIRELEDRDTELAMKQITESILRNLTIAADHDVLNRENLRNIANSIAANIVQVLDSLGRESNPL